MSYDRLSKMLLSQLGWDGVRVGDGDDAIEYGFQQHPYRSKNVAVVINNQYCSLFLNHCSFFLLSSLKAAHVFQGTFLETLHVFQGTFCSVLPLFQGTFGCKGIKNHRKVVMIV